MLRLMFAHIHRFLEDSNYTDATRSSYGYVLKRLANWLEKRGFTFDALDPGLFKGFLNEQNWGNNAQRLAGNAMKSFIRWHCGHDHPALLVKLPRDDSGPQRALSADQVDQLLPIFNTMTPKGWRDLSIVTLILESGIRESEICRLTLRHLHLDERRFSVLAKGNKWRTGIFSDYTANCLENWLACRKGIAKSGVENVFVGIGGTKPGTQMTPGGMRAVFRKFASKAGFSGLSPHDLRRTMVTLMTEQGAPVKIVQLLGGWESTNMVIRYSRSMELDHEYLEKYSPILAALGLGKM